MTRPAPRITARTGLFAALTGATLTVAALCATPALAQPATATGTSGLVRMPTALVPGLTSTNVSNATNVGAGIGNTAAQRGTVLQGGASAGRGGMGPLVSTNVGTATNVAAGIGNSAGQSLFGAQGRGVQVGLNFTGRGPLVSTNVGVATNVAAGIGNSAGQRLLGARR